jgi:hypothetical protein
MASISEELLTAQFPLQKAVRLIGVSLSSLSPDWAQVDPQMTLALQVGRVARERARTGICNRSPRLKCGSEDQGRER